MTVGDLKKELKHVNDDCEVVFDTINQGFWFVQSCHTDLLASNGFGAQVYMDDQFNKPINALVLTP